MAAKIQMLCVSILFLVRIGEFIKQLYTCVTFFFSLSCELW